MRLIDADALKAEWTEPTDWMDRDQTLCHITWFRAVIDNMPTIDPVKHGRWIYTSDGYGYAGNPVEMCSVCGAEYEEAPFNYCPNCGSKMDEVENG